MEVKRKFYAVIFHGAFSCMRRGNYGKRYGYNRFISKTQRFCVPGSDIYGGLSNTWDYGPLGVELKTMLKSMVAKFITQSPFNVGIDAAILMNPKVWEASGHLNNFNDPMIDNKDSKIRYRADKLIEDYMQDVKGDENFIADGLSFEQMKNH